MIALWKETVDLAASLQENNLLPTDWIYDNLFQFSEDKFDELRELLVADKKRAFRLKQIEEEGNDPLATGQAFGTPHQIASMYGGNANYTAAAGPVPQGYNELTDEPRPLPGRPSENPSIIGTEDDPLGRDRTGRADMNNNSKAGEDGSLKTNYQGGSALALEQTARVYLQNKSLLEGLKGRKVSLFENKVDEGLLDESNLKGDIE
jgi:hypothetical protein